ncbi:MAG: acyl-CoA dehydrogenase [Acidimicrobiales bacterium]|jgi:alkylation response protein AidB-like acyl-CoA dehydrogenase
MHFAFTEQQTEFQEAVRRVLAKECTTEDLRVSFDHPAARTPRWATLTELGVVGLTVPEDHGGLGLGLVDLVPLLEEAGRVALPEPLMETTALAAPLLAELAELGGTGSSRADLTAPWLEAIAAGRAAAAVGTGRDTGRPARTGQVVPAAAGADLLVLVTADQGGGPEIHVIGGDAANVRPVPSLDPTRRLGIPEWAPDENSRLAAGPRARDAIDRTADRAGVATAAELLGLADRMIAIAAGYAKERHQFGKPIGSFQAVKHLLAGARVQLEFARPVVYAAAWALDDAQPDASRAASVAKAYASDAATEAARVSLQVHGAIGYTWECDLQLFLKRAWALAASWGSAADHRARVLESLVTEG